MKSPLNAFNVPLAKWRKWSAVEKNLFNSLYATMSDQGLFSHPKAVKQRRACWNTTRWNAAWLAADYAAELRKDTLR